MPKRKTGKSKLESLSPEDAALLRKKAEASQEKQKEETRQKALEKISGDLPSSVNLLWSEVEQYAAVWVHSLFEMGRRLLVLREMVPRGEFLKGLERRGLSMTSAYRAMGAFNKFSKLPTVGSLPVRKIDLLLSVPDKEIDLEAQTVLGMDVDAIERMEYDDLRDTVRRQKGQIVKGAVQLKKSEEENRDLRRKAQESIYMDKDVRERALNFSIDVASALTARFGPLDFSKISPMSARQIFSALLLGQRAIHEFFTDIARNDDWNAAFVAAEEFSAPEEIRDFIEMAEKWLGVVYRPITDENER